MNRVIHSMLFLIGFSTMIGQIIIMRELLVIFYGNELTIGITLGVWLIATALGSGILGRLVLRRERPIQYLAAAFFSYSILIIATLLFIRFTPLLMNRAYGEITGIIPIIGTTLITLLPLCLVGGILFCLGYKSYELLQSHLIRSVSKAYLFESAGAAIGGLVVSLVLVRFFSHLLIASFIVSIASVVFYWPGLHFTRRRAIKIIFSLAVILVNISIYSHVAFFERLTRQSLWQNTQLLYNKDTIYGNISIIQQENSISFYENGLLMFTYPSLLTAEELVHFTMLEHPNPRTILLIGGGVNGSLNEILKYPTVEYIDYVELDAKIIQLAYRFLPESVSADLNSPRVHLNHIDGRRFIRVTEKCYDVILLNLTDPYNTFVNRFFTHEFFQEAAAKLTAYGVLGFGITSSENFISAEQAELLACLMGTLDLSFADHAIIPGDMNYILGCKAPNQLTLAPERLIARLQQWQIPTTFIREYYLPFRLTPERIAYLNEQIRSVKNPRINRDFAPAGYYYNMILWSTQFTSASQKFFKTIASWKLNPLLMLVLLLAATLLPWIFSGRCNNFRFSTLVLLAIAMIGFTVIALEFLIIIAFQVIWGYAYNHLGLIIACYMTGLTIGSFLSKRFLDRNPKPFPRFIQFQLLMAIFPLLLIGIFMIAHQAILLNYSFIVRFLFYIVAFLAGHIGGYQFPLACALMILRSRQPDKVGSMVYALDLAGSCLGALTVSAILLPIIGLKSICMGLAGLSWVIFVSMWLDQRRSS